MFRSALQSSGNERKQLDLRRKGLIAAMYRSSGLALMDGAAGVVGALVCGKTPKPFIDGALPDDIHRFYNSTRRKTEAASAAKRKLKDKVVEEGGKELEDDVASLSGCELSDGDDLEVRGERKLKRFDKTEDWPAPQKLVVFAHHQEVLDRIEEELLTEEIGFVR